MAGGAVVVVDDEVDLLELIGDVLEEEGYRTVRFSRPAAISLEAGLGSSAFLVDLMLPGMDGIELVRSLRQTLTETPMIAMSASPTMLAAARSSGLFQAVIAKPFDMDELLATVERFAGTG